MHTNSSLMQNKTCWRLYYSLKSLSSIFSAEIPIALSGAEQSTTEGENTASLAIDGNISTSSQTNCLHDNTIWFKVNFTHIYCVKKVRLTQVADESARHLVWRMQDTNLTILNSKTGVEGLCSTLKMTANLTTLRPVPAWCVVTS